MNSKVFALVPHVAADGGAERSGVDTLITVHVIFATPERNRVGGQPMMVPDQREAHCLIKVGASLTGVLGEVCVVWAGRKNLRERVVSAPPGRRTT